MSARPPPRRAAVLAALATLAAVPARAEPPPLAATTIHLEREPGAGYTRPALAVEGCLAAALGARPAAAGVDVRVTFTVERDGATGELSIAPPVPAAAAAAVEAAFADCRWTPGLDAEGRPVVVRVTQPVRVHAGAPGPGARAAEPGPPPPPVSEGGAILRLDGEHAAGFRRPALEEPACLPAALRRHPAAAGLENTVRFAVLRDGSLGQFSFLTPVAPAVERAVVEAFEACAWRPALDPAGEPLAVWVVQPLKVAPLPAPERVQSLFP